MEKCFYVCYDAINDGVIFGGVVMIKVDELINIYKSVDLNKFLKKYTGLTLEENNLTLFKIQSQWKFLGNNSSNASAVGILTNGEKGLIERITNAIDAVIEK